MQILNIAKSEDRRMDNRWFLLLFFSFLCFEFVKGWRYPLKPLRRSLLITTHQTSSDEAPLPSNEPSFSTNPSIKAKLLRLIDKRTLFGKLNREFIYVSLPAFVALIADPLASFVDAMYVGRLGAVDQAAMGIAISSQYSIAKLYNDPLLKTSTSLVAGKSGDDLEASVATAITTAMLIGLVQAFLFLVVSEPILKMMGVMMGSEMLGPAIDYLKWRGLGIPAATLLLVTNSIFRGRGDTKTPLYCTIIGNIVNIILDPILIFYFRMGCAGAGAATAFSQWVTAIPLLYFLNKSIPIRIIGRDFEFFKGAIQSYLQAGGLIFIRTVAKVSAYAVTSRAAARLGTIPMAAYSLTFNLGFATSQLCESVSIAAQALLARDHPFDTKTKKKAAAHVMRLALYLGILISSGLSITTIIHQDAVIGQMSKSAEVVAAAKAIMPMVLGTQLLKGLAYSTGGIILGGLDWLWSSISVQAAALACVSLTFILKPSLNNIWVALAAFMGTQVLISLVRFLSQSGPWKGINIFDLSEEEAR